MNYMESLPGGVYIAAMEPVHAGELEGLQRLVFPSLAEEELLHAEQYRRHTEIFPEGQFVALDGETVVGAISTMRYSFDPEQPGHHSFYEVMGGGWLTTHEPDGAWLYVVDVSVHPAFRGRGIARALFRACRQTCIELNLKGQVLVGMLNGYEAVQEEITLEEYYERVRSGEIFDPTVSVQERIGFEMIGLVKDYLNDPTCGNAGALMILGTEREI